VEAHHVAQDERGALAGRQQLQGRDEGQFRLDPARIHQPRMARPGQFLAGAAGRVPSSTVLCAYSFSLYSLNARQKLHTV
jgi:hypothetical protein